MRPQDRGRKRSGKHKDLAKVRRTARNWYRKNKQKALKQQQLRKAEINAQRRARRATHYWRALRSRWLGLDPKLSIVTEWRLENPLFVWQLGDKWRRETLCDPLPKW